MKRNRSVKKSSSLFLGLIVLIFLIVIALMYLALPDYSRDTSLIGDRVCGELSSIGGQSHCCAQAHVDEVHIQCVGSWRYESSTGLCSYKCDSVDVCTEEVKLCPDGTTYVSRNASIGCAFNPCP